MRLGDVLRIQGRYEMALGAMETAELFVNRLAPSERDTATDVIGSFRDKITSERDKSEREAKEQDERTARETQERREKERIAKVRLPEDHLKSLPRDIVLSIAEHGSRGQTGFLLRMTGVCKAWRETLLEQPRLWRSFVLTPRRPADKAALWLQRSGDRINEIIVETGLRDGDCHAALRRLGYAISHVRRISGHLCPHELRDHTGGFHLLRHLDVDLYESDVQSTRENVPIDLDLSFRKYCRLESVRWKGGRVEVFRDDALLELAKISMEYTEVFTSRRDLMTTAPLMTHVVLKNVFFRDMNERSPRNNQGQRRQRKKLRLESLVEWTEPGAVLKDLIFDDAEAPALRHLDLFSVRWADRECQVLRQVMADGLSDALPNLETLDIGKSPVDTADLLETLKWLPNLKFLNVSYCGLDDSFIPGITIKEELDEEEQLLPRLTALSIAGHPSLTSRPIINFVNSRLPYTERWIPKPRAPAKTTAGAFKPVSKKPSQLEVSALLEVEPFLPSSLATPSQAARPRLAWLNLDQCDGIEFTALTDILKPRIKFVSHWLGGDIPEDRVRGKGQYAWDADWHEECVREGDGKCYLRKKQDGKNWEVVHLCAPRRNTILSQGSQQNVDDNVKGWERIRRVKA